MVLLSCLKFYLKRVFGVKLVISKQVAEQIWQIQLKTRKTLSGMQLGELRALSKGSGSDFDQVREYVQGDDLRFIDWKSSARAGKLLTKQFFADCNYRILIALDVSASSFVGTGERTKYGYMSELAAIFALVAEHNKDSVGLVLFTDQIELQLPVMQGKEHIFKLLTAVFTYGMQVHREAKTDLGFVFKKLAQNLKQKSLIVVISDFIDDHDYQKSLKQLQCRHDVVAVRYLDIYEQQLIPAGILPIMDPETGQTGVINTQKTNLNLCLKNRVSKQDQLLRGCGIDVLQINDLSVSVVEIVKFFRKRLVY